MVDDTGLLCDAYNTTEFGEKDCTRIFVIPKNRFPAWLAKREKGLKNIPEKELADEDSKMGDVCLIIESMLENEYCTEQNIPQTAIAWDLVRVINVGRWAYLCSYITEDEMWQIMQLTVNTAMQQFSSWKEYGLSFVLGRGVWHGDSDDSETAHEIVSTLLEREESPWKQFMWNNTCNK